MRFDTEVTVTGPWRTPAQMLAEQSVGGQSSIHDDASASALGLAGAPIEAPTHFSQIDPLAVTTWGQAWFERGCVSAHFRTMVVEPERVQASLTTSGGSTARVEVHKEDGTPVLEGSASIGPDHGETFLEIRRRGARPPGELFILDQLEIGMVSDGGAVAIAFDESNGAAYPFTLAEKLDRITEPHPWYTADGGRTSPWGRPILPIEMISVLAQKSGGGFPTRGPVLGLFLDLEIRLVDGPLFVDQPYAVRREVVGLGESRRTESCWTRTTLTDATTGRAAAAVLLHSGFFKESFAGYPRERL